MMIEARFTSEMRDILKEVIGVELIGYSASAIYAGETVHDGEIYFHFSDRTIKIFNETRKISWFKHKDLSDVEDIFSFSCTETIEEAKQKKLVQERIEKIEIITDYIKIPKKNYDIALDMALIIVTSGHRYMISRGWQFGEYLDINIDKNYDEIYSVEQVIEDWNNFGEWEVAVVRGIQQL